MRGSWRNWGQTRKCLVTAFNDLALHKVAVGHVAGKGASRRVIDKLGFRLIGKQRVGHDCRLS